MPEDGARGLACNQDTGGTAVVQSPDSASVPTMPEAALRLIEAEHVLSPSEIGQLLARMDGRRTMHTET